MNKSIFSCIIVLILFSVNSNVVAYHGHHTDWMALCIKDCGPDTKNKSRKKIPNHSAHVKFNAAKKELLIERGGKIRPARPGTYKLMSDTATITIIVNKNGDARQK